MENPQPRAASELFGSRRQAVAVLVECAAWVLALLLLAMDAALLTFVDPGGWWDRFTGVPVIGALVAVGAMQWWSHATGNRRGSRIQVARAEGVAWPRIPRFLALSAACYLNLPARAARRAVSAAEFVWLASFTAAIGIGTYQVLMLTSG